MSSAPSAQEAAAIVAAIERFMGDVAPPPPPDVSPWARAALLEGAGHAPDARGWGGRE